MAERKDLGDKPLFWHLMSLFTVTIWGITFVSTKVLLEYLLPVEILFIRFLLAYVVLWLFYPHRPSIKSWKTEGLFLGLGISGVSFYFLLENIALQHTATSNVGLLVSVAPILTALFAHWFLKGEKFRPNLLMGFFLAITGIGFVMFNGQESINISPVGDLLAVGAAGIWAVYSILLKKVEERLNPIYVTRKIFFYGLVTAFPFLFVFDSHLSFSVLLLPRVFFNLLFLGLVASALCYVIWNTAVSKIGVVKTSTYIYLIPLVTIIAAIVILGERLTMSIIAGAALILLGTYISERRR